MSALSSTYVSKAKHNNNYGGPAPSSSSWSVDDVGWENRYETNKDTMNSDVSSTNSNKPLLYYEVHDDCLDVLVSKKVPTHPLSHTL